MKSLLRFCRSLAKVGLLCCLLAAPPTLAAAQAVAPQASNPANLQPQSNLQPPAVEAEQSYVLGPEDVLEVQVLGRSDFNTRARVGADGKIQLPFLGTVEASGKTTRQLADELGRALQAGGYFARPIMRVEVVSFASRYVIVLGAVASPGLVPVNRAYRLSEIIARVGGIRDNGADHVIVRPETGAERRISMQALATGDVSQDPYVAAGDKIFVPTADVFYISGQIKAPGAYPLSSSMTLRMAIARGGGLTELGSDRRVQITRQGRRLERVELDGALQPGDVIVIGERLF
jgi:polysaccharide biosynthesis/export protein